MLTFPESDPVVFLSIVLRMTINTQKWALWSAVITVFIPHRSPTKEMSELLF